MAWTEGEPLRAVTGAHAGNWAESFTVAEGELVGRPAASSYGAVTAGQARTILGLAVGDSPTFAGVYATTFDTNVTAARLTLSGTTLAADGTDANIDIAVTPKGTGILDIPTNYGIKIGAAGDADADLITVNVAGNPLLKWDETIYGGSFSFNHPVAVTTALGIDGADGVILGTGSDEDIDLLSVAVTDTPKLWWDESEDVFTFTKGIASTTLSVTGKINHNSSITDPGTMYAAYNNNSTLTVTGNGTYNMRAFSPVATTKISNGVTNTNGYLVGGWIQASRHLTDDDGDMTGAGTNNGIQAMRVAYGHIGTNTGDTISTEVAYGLIVLPYRQEGTIVTMYDIYLAAEFAGGAVTNAWGIYQANTKANYFGGATEFAKEITLASLADTAAANSTLYYSTDQSKLVYKDSGGVVRDLW